MSVPSPRWRARWLAWTTTSRRTTRSTSAAATSSIWSTSSPTSADSGQRGHYRWIRGNLDWSANTPRYRKHGRPTVVVADQRHGEVARFTPPPGVAWWWSRLRNVIPEQRHNQSGQLTAQVAAN